MYLLNYLIIIFYFYSIKYNKDQLSIKTDI